MSDVIKIEGQHLLEGTLYINGAKNATVALIPAACMSMREPVTIYGVPQIEDVNQAIDLLNELNVNVEWVGNDALKISPMAMENNVLGSVAVTKYRASYYFMGVLLGKYKKVQIKMPGGCDLGSRPINLHLKGFEALGAKCHYSNGYYYIEAKELIGDKIYLDFASVGATINIMYAAVYAKGRTIIENAAKEPEIIDLATMLNRMGAKIKGAGTSVITIDGVKFLGGCIHEMIPDRIAAGTYLIIAAAMGKKVRIQNIIPHHLESLISKLDEMGVDVKIGIDYVEVSQAKNLKPVDITTQTYPGFPTDLQQPLTALLTQCQGVSSVKETIYKERFKHCQELMRMGAVIDVNSPVARISGSSELFGENVRATDLRCGACLIVAGLMAKGITTIDDIYHIERGYENIVENLASIGAKIWREELK